MAEKPLALSDRLGLRPAEVARVLGLSERSIRQILPELPHLRIGSSVVIPVDSLREWLRERAKAERGRVEQVTEEILKSMSHSR